MIRATRETAIAHSDKHCGSKPQKTYMKEHSQRKLLVYFNYVSEEIRRRPSLNQVVMLTGTLTNTYKQSSGHRKSRRYKLRHTTEDRETTMGIGGVFNVPESTVFPTPKRPIFLSQAYGASKSTTLIQVSSHNRVYRFKREREGGTSVDSL